LRGISKSFTGVRVLEGVDFSVREGEVHALVGENGAGKSTLMNIVSGVEPAGAGEILFDGQPVRLRGPRDAQALGISFVHQELALVPHLSAAENIFLGRHPARGGWVAWREIYDRARELLAELGRTIDPRRLVTELSLAERQLVEIARALAFRARLIIMDEPTAPLSEHDAAGLYRAIAHLRDRGVGVIFISHRMKEIFQISDRVTVMRDGRNVLTVDTAAASHDELVRAMIGSEMKERLEHPPATHQGREVLRVEGPMTVTLRQGEIVGLAGLAGAGRTELLEWLFGAGNGTSGRVFLEGRPVEIRSPQDAIGHGFALVPDDRKAKGLVLGASVESNIALTAGRRRFWIDRGGESSAARRLVSELRIRTASIEQAVRYLSGGNQQKVVIARWLLARARIFLLDEPTRGIDVRSKAEIYDLVRVLARGGATVLLASSDLEELLGVADRIVVLHRGRVAGELSREAANEESIMRLATGGSE
jgi:ribose transport system ATP-binding protein